MSKPLHPDAERYLKRIQDCYLGASATVRDEFLKWIREQREHETPMLAAGGTESE